MSVQRRTAMKTNCNHLQSLLRKGVDEARLSFA